MTPNGTAAEPTAAEDLAVLFPDVDVTVRDPDTGEAVPLTVRELRFLEGLRLVATYQPLVSAIAASADGNDEGIDEGAIAAALTEHAEAWIACIAQATGQEAAWLARLSDADGQVLSLAMWSANKDFFGRRLVEAVRRRKRARPSPSPTSSMPSSGPGTAEDTATSPSG